MFRFEHFDLCDINGSPDTLNRLYFILKETVSRDLTLEEFGQYLFGLHPDWLAISFISKEDDLVGFCTAAAYPQRCNGKKVVILRSAFGLREDQKKGNFPLQGLFYKYMRYKLRHLFTPVYVAGFMANPLMYAMICKYTLWCYPRHGQSVPPAICTLKDHLLHTENLKEAETPFVLKIQFPVRFSLNDKKRFVESRDKHVQHFLSINPGYQQQQGVLVIVPVTLLNMAFTLARHLYRRVAKWSRSWSRLLDLRYSARPAQRETFL